VEDLPMRGLRMATLLLAVVMILLPPRWCCAIPYVQAECCTACKAAVESGESCCVCKAEKQTRTKERPCQCRCQDERAQLARGPEIDPAGTATPLVVALGILPNARHSSGHLVVEMPPPRDVQSRLCRWLI
jgi:hypothetical protein